MGNSAKSSRGYYIASIKSGNLKDWHAETTDADSEISYDLPELQRRSRDAIRNFALARGVINTKVTNVISTGIHPHPCVDYQRLGISEDQANILNRQIKDEFALFAEGQDFDISGNNNFYQVQSVLYRAVLEAGNVLSLIFNKDRRNNPYSTRVQLIEGDLLSNKDYAINTDNLTDGIERNESGEVIRYHFLQNYLNTPKLTDKRNTWRTVEKFGANTGLQNVVHLFHQTRPGQHKGIPELTSVIYLLKQLDKYTTATIDAAILASEVAVFVTSADGSTSLMGDSDSGDKKNEYTSKGTQAVNLAEGETVEFNNPTYPSANFDQFIISILKQISSATEVPVELLVKSFAASYAASRVNMLDFAKLVFRDRKFVVTDFCMPVYERFMFELAASGRVPLPGYLSSPDPIVKMAYLKTNWVGSHTSTSINPLQEMNAVKIAHELGMVTMRDETLARTGRSWDDQQIQVDREKEVLKMQETGADDAATEGDDV